MTSSGDLPPLASPVRRLGGFIADLLILVAVALVLAPFTGVSGGDELARTSAFALANLVVLALYQVAFVAYRGQTPGKMIVQTRVIDATTQQVPGFTAALARFALPAAAGFLPSPGSLLALLVYVWLIWDARTQGLHDKLANTVVVDVPRS